MTCCVCQQPFDRLKKIVLSNHKKGRERIYCSNKCQALAKSLEGRTVVQCAECFLSFSKMNSQIRCGSNNFCSKSCSAAYNNTHRVRKDRRPDFLCINCGIVKKSSHKNQKFCGVSCQHDHRAKERYKELEDGANLTHKICRSYWLSKNRTCSCCGLSEWNGLDIPLELDHINGDGTDNTLENTRLLCPNCHAQTDNYKSKNANNPLGKEFRKLRYSKNLK